VNTGLETGVSLVEAARELGVSVSTIRRWIRDGAPTVSLGGPGRGKGSRVDVQELRAWLAGGTAQCDGAAALRSLEATIREVYAGEVEGMCLPAHALIGIEPIKAAAYLVHFWRVAVPKMIGQTPDGTPQIIQDLIALGDR